MDDGGQYEHVTQSGYIMRHLNQTKNASNLIFISQMYLHYIYS